MISPPVAYTRRIYTYGYTYLQVGLVGGGGGGGGESWSDDQAWNLP